jgi:hypothetical protein
LRACAKRPRRYDQMLGSRDIQLQLLLPNETAGV